MIGVAGYEKSFGLQFADEADLGPSTHLDERSRIIVLDKRYGLRGDLAGKRVALVGNGSVENCGRLIDDHDEVIRISAMGSWRRSVIHDGERVTIWAGHPWLVVHRNSLGEPEPISLFAELVAAGVQLWALSPFHISFDAYKWMSTEGLLDRLVVAPPPAVIYDIACTYLDAEEISQLFSIPPNRKHLVGIPHFDLLLTGTRLALLLELSGVKHLSLYGFGLFDMSTQNVWFGHDLQTDLRVLVNMKRRIVDGGGRFYWHEEDRVRGAASDIRQR
jgi:hypothetical protein